MKSTKIIAALGVAAGLGASMLPVAGFAATSESSEETVKLVVAESVSIAVDATENSTDADANDKATSETPTTITAATSSTKGLNITVIDKDETTALVNGDNAKATIPAVDGKLTAGTAGWNITGGDLTNKAVPASTGTALTVYKGTTNEEKTVSMNYNFATASNQQAGTYTDVITYTVSVNE